MLEIERTRLIFKIKEVWFSDYPFDLPDYDYVIFNACRSIEEYNGFYRQDFNTLIIDLNREIDDIWKDMSKSSCRYAINRAIKDGVQIIINDNYEDFLEINRSFRKNKGLTPYNLDKEFMKKNGILFVSEKDGEILSGQFYLRDNQNIRWLIGASKRLEVNKEKSSLIGNANRLLLWEAIKHSKRIGLKEFDFGGYYIGSIKNVQKEQINSFKKSFGGELVKKSTYKKYYNYSLKVAYNMLEHLH